MYTGINDTRQVMARGRPYRMPMLGFNLMALPDFKQYPAYHRPIGPTPLDLCLLILKACITIYILYIMKTLKNNLLIMVLNF